MARLKTAYREKIPAADNNPAPSVPVDEEPPQPSETTRVEFTNGGDKAEPSVAIVSADEYPQPDEATVALMRQLDHLRASEQAQKDFAAQVAAQRAAQMAAQPPTREQKLAMWKEQGMDPEDAEIPGGESADGRPARCDPRRVRSSRAAGVRARHRSPQAGDQGDIRTSTSGSSKRSQRSRHGRR